MKIEDLLQESPQSIDPFEFNLNNKEFNIKMATKYLANKNKHVLESIDNGNYTLYKINFSYILINHSDNLNPQISYMVKFQTTFHKFINRKCVCQIAVWRNKADGNTKNIAEKIFFDYLLKDYQTIITDSMQTSDGQGFWDIRITDALRKNLFVYFINFLQTREIVRINNDKEYRDLKDNKPIWGDHEKFQSKRVIITNKELATGV